MSCSEDDCFSLQLLKCSHSYNIAMQSFSPECSSRPFRSSQVNENSRQNFPKDFSKSSQKRFWVRIMISDGEAH